MAEIRRPGFAALTGHQATPHPWKLYERHASSGHVHLASNVLRQRDDRGNAQEYPHPRLEGAGATTYSVSLFNYLGILKDIKCHQHLPGPVSAPMSIQPFQPQALADIKPIPTADHLHSAYAPVMSPICLPLVRNGRR